jgi:hypothetical protein
MIVDIFNSNKFLKADDCKTGDLIKILTEGAKTKSKTYKYPELTQKGTPHPKAGEFKDQFEVKVSIGSGEERTLTMNATSYRALAGKWGEDTLNWVGKLAVVTIAPLPTGKKAIILTPED